MNLMGTVLFAELPTPVRAAIQDLIERTHPPVWSASGTAPPEDRL